MKKLGKTGKSNNYRIRFNFPFFGWGGGSRPSKSKHGFFSMSGTATLLSKYGNAGLKAFSPCSDAGPVRRSQARGAVFVGANLACMHRHMPHLQRNHLTNQGIYCNSTLIF